VAKLAIGSLFFSTVIVCAALALRVLEPKQSRRKNGARQPDKEPL